MNKKLLTLAFVTITFLSCQQESKDKIIHQKSTSKQQTDALTDENHYTYKTTFSPDIGWGYQILNNGDLYINQPHIPAIPGKEGFLDEAKAIKTAKYIINKLENNIFPPTISVDELDSLAVLK